MIAYRTPSFYVAARSEDQACARLLRDLLVSEGLISTARWVDLADLTAIEAKEAETCLLDICAADVVVLYSHPHEARLTSGGHHVETGYALALAKPVVIFGERVNVFHALRSVQVVGRSASVKVLADTIRQVAALPNAAGRAIAVEAGRG